MVESLVQRRHRKITCRKLFYDLTLSKKLCLPEILWKKNVFLGKPGQISRNGYTVGNLGFSGKAL